MYLPDRAANECDQLSMAGRATADGFKSFLLRRPSSEAEFERTVADASSSSISRGPLCGLAQRGWQVLVEAGRVAVGDEAGPASVALALVQGATNPTLRLAGDSGDQRHPVAMGHDA